jgi:hypothetical protein
LLFFVAFCGKNLLGFKNNFVCCAGIRGLVKSATCITMDRKVLEWIQRKVEEGVFASRSHAVEYAVRQLMRQERKPNT